MHGKSLGCNTGICWARVLVRSHFKLADAAEVSPSEGMLFFLSLTACHGSFTSSWSKISLYSKICLENSCTAAPDQWKPFQTESKYVVLLFLISKLLMYSQANTATVTTWIINKVFFLLVVHLPRTQVLITQSCLVTKEQCQPEILKQTLIARTKQININCLIPLNIFCIKASRTTFFLL